MAETEFLAPFERLLGEHFSPDRLREMQSDEGAGEQALAALAASGFLDVMLPEETGGAGLSMLGAEPLIRSIGQHAAPASIATEMTKRAIGSAPSRELSAVLYSILTAGALEKLLTVCTEYANMREQFGKPIGKQQSIQHQLALLAEKSALVRVTAQYGCANGFDISAERAAVAKCVASAAVPLATSVAHAIHGAIGVTAEHDLQLWVKCLYEWHAAAGSESYWAGKMGKSRLINAAEPSVDFVRGI